MARHGMENLRTPTSEEAREIGAKGGIASGKARRRKKAMRETLEVLLSMSMEDGDTTDIDDIQSYAATMGQNVSVQEAIMLAQIQKALAGDTKAAEFVRDASGNKLADALNVSGNISNPFAGLTTEELRKLAGEDG